MFELLPSTTNFLFVFWESCEFLHAGLAICVRAEQLVRVSRDQLAKGGEVTSTFTWSLLSVACEVSRTYAKLNLSW